jgi:hypothetical protein
MDISVLGVDLGKNVCSVVGLDASGAVVMRRKVRRETLIARATPPPARGDLRFGLSDCATSAYSNSAGAYYYWRLPRDRPTQVRVGVGAIAIDGPDFDISFRPSFSATRRRSANWF